MERAIIDDLKKWKNSPDRKPLILLGARQVGKTWTLLEFGRQAYKNVAYVNFDNNTRLENLFTADYDISRILRVLEMETGERILPGETLIIMDEVQEVKRGIHSLKYFCEDARQYHVAVAGSLLGIAMRPGESFPVGKVDLMRLYPMSFEEFLLAKGKPQFVEALRQHDWELMQMMHDSYVELLREYYFVGGMPEVVEKYIRTNSPIEVRRLQNAILEAYRKDVSKHAPKQEVERIQMVWQSIPSQLSKENKKFIFGVLKPGGRAREYEVAIQWLIDAGLVYKVSRIKKAEMPLISYEELGIFKLFFLDVGLLTAMAKLSLPDIQEGKNILSFKGAFTENYVLSQLEIQSEEMAIYYYSRNDSQMEVDFVVQYAGRIIPIEVKAEDNLKSKSLKSFVNSHPGLRGIRFSMTPYREQDWMINVPLYAINSYFIPLSIELKFRK